MSTATVYDYEKDDVFPERDTRSLGELVEFELGIAAHTGRLSAALKAMLVAPNDPVVRELAQAAQTVFEQWLEKWSPEHAVDLAQARDRFVAVATGGGS